MGKSLSSEVTLNMVLIEELTRYCKSDFVLASVGRLHEIIGGGNVGTMGGLEKTDVKARGVDNVDLGGILKGMVLSCFFLPR